MKTGRMSQARADSIAYYAVRESYVNGIPPAVVFGVMLTENARFVSGAMSNVGAVGLMQVYPKVWLKALRAKFGSDLATDSTNLKYGIYILSLRQVRLGQGPAGDLSKGLLRYNGCVRGHEYAALQDYPSKVKTYVEQQGMSICGDKSFYDCIAKPFIAGFLGKGIGDGMTSTRVNRMSRARPFRKSHCSPVARAPRESRRDVDAIDGRLHRSRREQREDVAGERRGRRTFLLDRARSRSTVPRSISRLPRTIPTGMVAERPATVPISMMRPRRAAAECSPRGTRRRGDRASPRSPFPA